MKNMKTHTISLKPTTEKEYEEYYTIRCSPSDIYWNGYTDKPNKESFKELYKRRLSSAPFVNAENRRLYLIELCSENVKSVSIGFVQLIKHDEGVEIGYTVIEEYQRHGYATDAVLKAIELALVFSKKIFVRIRDDNIASQKVALKCGFASTEEYQLKEYPEVGRIKLRKYVLNNV